MIVTIERDEDMPGVQAQLDVIEALRRWHRPLRHCDGPWIEVRWANPRYL